MVHCDIPLRKDVSEPKIVHPTDAIIKLSATFFCGSDLWPYRGLNEVNQPMHMGHEYCGVVVEVGKAVKTVKPGQFVVGSFCISDNTCPHCRLGFQSSGEQRESMTAAQATQCPSVLGRGCGCHRGRRPGEQPPDRYRGGPGRRGPD